MNANRRLLSFAYRLVLMVSLVMALVTLPAELSTTVFTISLANAQGLPQNAVTIASESLFASRWSGVTHVNLAAPAMAMEKHVPNNAVTPKYTEGMAATDHDLATIFGGPNAIAAANGFEPGGLAHQYPIYRGDIVASDGRLLRGHLSYAMHLYGSEDGTAETEIYVPLGFTSHSNEPTPTDAVITFYYPRIGNLTDVTLAVFHVAKFRLSYEGGRVRIGTIGGPGGSIASYKHSHLEFYRGDTGLPPLVSRSELRINPTTVFEPISDTAASRSKTASSARSAY